ncbi:MAG: hypothetical protein VR72_17245 [Clostridiaceae bacterium BRH_c20a]|nr:MAG: hypothetical protein VR72_17245 [Clostridiaceae bacterium BRH_c20a]
MPNFRKILNFYYRIEEILPIVLFVLILLITGAQVVARYVFVKPFSWAEEISRLFFIWMIFIGAATAVRENTHIRLEALDNILPRKGRVLVNIVIGLLGLAFALVTITQGYIWLIQVKGYSPALHIDIKFKYVIVPISMFLIIIYLIRKMIIALKDWKGV